ncbi:MAG TPA: CBS domain-containing protein, partial [Polyangiaceae bacterium]
MKRRVLTVHATLSVNQAANRMKTEQVGFFPVCDDTGRTLGVLTDRDIVLRVAAKSLDGDGTPVEQVMTPDPVFCAPEDDLEHAEALMLKHHTRRILVLEGEKLVG